MPLGMATELRHQRWQGTRLEDAQLYPELASEPDLAAVAVGLATVGDARQGDLCLARVSVEEGVLTSIELRFLSTVDQEGPAEYLRRSLIGRPIADVLTLVEGRACHHSGCSSVEGKCFNLAQEAIFRALKHYELQLAAPVIIGGRWHDPDPESRIDGEAIEAWARALIRQDDGRYYR